MSLEKVPLPPFIKRTILIPYRLKIALSYFCDSLSNAMTWLFSSKETSNFTYDLTLHNRQNLAATLAVVTGQSIEKILSIFEELDHDMELKNHVLSLAKNSDFRYKSDPVMFYGRRLGWYALARILKPKVVIETGVDKGLGTIVLATALLKNKQEGFPGTVYGADINPAAGFLVKDKYCEVIKLLVGDSLETLKKFDAKIDLFINDSDHSAIHEEKEYEIIAAKLSKSAVVLGDNAHQTDKLFQFSKKTGRNFFFFKEEPKEHWYPGAGIGISFSKTVENH